MVHIGNLGKMLIFTAIILVISDSGTVLHLWISASTGERYAENRGGIDQVILIPRYLNPTGLILKGISGFLKK